jgi:DNA polymerase V
LDWRHVTELEQRLKNTALADIWGISRRWSVKLQAYGIANAYALREAEPKQIREHFGVVMERIVQELRGIPCIPFADMPPPKKQIMTSRSFGIRLTEYADLLAAVTHFACRAAEKLRQQQQVSQALSVFIETSRFDTAPAYYSNCATTIFDLPHNDSRQMIQAASQGLAKIFKSGCSYQRAGILLPDLLPDTVAQMSLFALETDTARPQQLMATLDQINHKYGRNTLCYGSELLSERWHMRQFFKSPS